jgi:hypothetical protein
VAPRLTTATNGCRTFRPKPFRFLLHLSISIHFASRYYASQNLEVLADFVEIRLLMPCRMASRSLVKMLLEKPASSPDAPAIGSQHICQNLRSMYTVTLGVVPAIPISPDNVRGRVATGCTEHRPYLHPKEALFDGPFEQPSVVKLGVSIESQVLPGIGGEAASCPRQVHLTRFDAIHGLMASTRKVFSATAPDFCRRFLISPLSANELFQPQEHKRRSGDVQHLTVTGRH